MLWILDGLDEVVELSLRETVSGWIQTTVGHRDHDWFVVTSRFQGYKSDKVLLGANFLEFHVHGLSNDHVKVFIERWFAAAHRRVDGPGQVAQQKALTDTTTLKKVLETAPYQAPSMREMVTNPLLLTILCVVYHEEHNLPGAVQQRRCPGSAGAGRVVDASGRSAQHSPTAGNGAGS
jgi:predicted NACHT family NTPase